MLAVVVAVVHTVAEQHHGAATHLASLEPVMNFMPTGVRLIHRVDLSSLTVLSTNIISSRCTDEKRISHVHQQLVKREVLSRTTSIMLVCCCGWILLLANTNVRHTIRVAAPRDISRGLALLHGSPCLAYRTRKHLLVVPREFILLAQPRRVRVGCRGRELLIFLCVAQSDNLVDFLTDSNH